MMNGVCHRLTDSATQGTHFVSTLIVCAGPKMDVSLCLGVYEVTEYLPYLSVARFIDIYVIAYPR